MMRLYIVGDVLYGVLYDVLNDVSYDVSYGVLYDVFYDILYGNMMKVYIVVETLYIVGDEADHRIHI